MVKISPTASCERLSFRHQRSAHGRADHKRFTPEIQKIAASADRYVSQVCAIEMATKSSIGRLDLPEPFKMDFAAAFRAMVSELSAEVLDIDIVNIDRLSHLPLVHRDPFDRLIIAQALVGEMTIITSDRVFASYVGLTVLEI